jgi:hypothetical protein
MTQGNKSPNRVVQILGGSVLAVLVAIAALLWQIYTSIDEGNVAKTQIANQATQNSNQETQIAKQDEQNQLNSDQYQLFVDQATNEALKVTVEAQLRTPIATDSVDYAPTATALAIRSSQIDATSQAIATKQEELKATQTAIVGPLYLADLSPIRSVVGFGKLGVGVYPFTEGPFREGQPLQINGVKYPKAIFAHAPSEVEYSLPRRFSWFYASIYIDGHRNCGADGVASFVVLLDGQVVYQSPTITYNDTQKPLPISFTIGEGKILTLKTITLGAITCDWTIWGDPYLTP